MATCIKCGGTNLSFEGMDPEGRGRVYVCLTCYECFDETDVRTERQAES